MSVQIFLILKDRFLFCQKSKKIQEAEIIWCLLVLFCINELKSIFLLTVLKMKMFQTLFLRTLLTLRLLVDYSSFATDLALPIRKFNLMTSIWLPVIRKLMLHWLKTWDMMFSVFLTVLISCLGLLSTYYRWFASIYTGWFQCISC